MVGFEMPLRAPTSFLFFAATGIAMYYSTEVANLKWLAYSAFCVFLAVGPIPWIEQAIRSVQLLYRDDDGEYAIRSKEAIDVNYVVAWMAGMGQVLGFAGGAAFGIHGLLSLA